MDSTSTSCTWKDFSDVESNSRNSWMILSYYAILFRPDLLHLQSWA